ncbi:MAG: hypothetical protein M0Z50_18650 [Planctomycetia bacterium]|nr:hypothetical protein [Planctomycetia bacterium]
MDKKVVLDRYYLDCRSMLLEIAATLDRYDRAPLPRGESKPVDKKLMQLGQAIAVLAQSSAQPDRTERILNLLSEHAV